MDGILPGHDSEGLQWCRACEYRWTRGCEEPTCVGFRVVFLPSGPGVEGCAPCGVTTAVARTWPEAHRAVARALDSHKMEQTVVTILHKPVPKVRKRDIIR